MKPFVVGTIKLAAAAQAQDPFEMVEPKNSNKAVSDYIDPVSQYKLNEIVAPAP